MSESIDIGPIGRMRNFLSEARSKGWSVVQVQVPDLDEMIVQYDRKIKLHDAIADGGCDLSPCAKCGKLVVHLDTGESPWCLICARNEAAK